MDLLTEGQATTASRARFPMWQVGRMDMTTGDVDVITQAEGSAVRPVVSPDGRLLVYATRHETIDGARIIGFDQDLGSIEAGKLADLVVLVKNPLDDIRNTNTVRFVMKNGELFEGDTLTQVWPTPKELSPFWWWTSQPADRSAHPAR